MVSLLKSIKFKNFTFSIQKHAAARAAAIPLHGPTQPPLAATKGYRWHHGR